MGARGFRRCYLLAFLAAALAVGLRFAFSPWLGVRHALMLPLLAVAVVAGQGGFGPGVLTTALCLVAWIVCFILPFNGYRDVPFGDQLHLALFVAVGVVLSRWGQRMVDFRGRSGRLAELLDEVGDAVFTWRFDPSAAITYWNHGAERLYGFPASTARTQISHALLNTVFPIPRETIEATLIREGEWSGRLEHRTANGEAVAVLSRMILLTEPHGGQLVLETNFALPPQKLSEPALLSSREWARGVMDSVAEGIITINEAGLVQSVNVAAERLFGFSEAELVHRDVSLLMPEPERSEHRAYLDSYLRTGVPRMIGIGGEGEGLRRDGTRFPVELSVAEFVSGGQRYFTGVVRDISERRRAEEVNARLAAIIDSSEDAIVGKTLLGEITSWNAAAERLFGYTAKEAVGQNVRLIIPPDREDEEATILEKLCRGIPVHHYETVRRRKNGELVDVSLTVSPIRDRAGRVIGASKIARDITERRRIEEARREQLKLQTQLASIAATVPGAICAFRQYVDGRTTMPFATPVVEDLYGLSRESLAQDFSVVFANIHPDDLPTLRAGIDESLRQLIPWYGKYRYRHPSKGTRWIEGWSRPQVEPDGSVLWHGFVMDVTDQSRAEEARRESERLARSVLDSLRSSIALLEESGAIIDVNLAWRMFAAENGGLALIHLGANYLEICDSATGADCELARTFATGIRDVLAGRTNGFEMEYPCHSPTERRWFLGRVSPFQEGGPSRAVVSHQNITALKLVEENLRDRERLLAQSQRSAHVGSWELELKELDNIQRNELRWSDECYRIFGQEPDAQPFTSERFFEAVHPEDRPLIKELLARALHDGIPYEVDHRIRRPDGAERIVHEWGEVISDDQGHPVRMIGTCQDVTESRRAEAALRESEERLSVAVESAELGTWDRDMVTGRVRWSPRLEAMFELAPGEFGGTSEAFFERIHPADRPATERAAAHARESREPYQAEFRAVMRDGSTRWFASHGRFTYDFHGRAVRLAGVIQNITKRKQAEDELRKYISRLAFLRETETAILAARSPQEIAEAALRHLRALIPSWTAGIARFDFAQGFLETIATAGLLYEWHPPGTRLPLPPEELPRMIEARRGEIEIVADVSARPPSFRLISLLRDHGLLSYVHIPLRYKNELIGIIFFGSDQLAAYTPEHVEIAREVLDPIAIALHQAFLIEELRIARERAELLTRQVIRAEEDERRRIARELHDEIGQSLTAMKINLQAALEGPADADARLEENLEIVSRALQQVRGTALDLRPSILDDLGLVAALNWYVHRHAERTGLIGRFLSDPAEMSVDPEIATACFRVAQEALTNIARHARASKYSVELIQHSQGLHLVIRDDGAGFDRDDVLRGVSRGDSVGLASMRERVNLVGGRIVFVSKPGEGTEVQVEFPSTPSAKYGETS